MTGVQLLLEHPEVAYRDCADCILYQYDHSSGRRELDRDGKPIPRPSHSKGPPCMYHPKACAKGSPTAGIALNAKNQRAYQFHQECKAVGDFPNDPLVREHAVIIESIVSNHEKLFQLKMMSGRG